jgi:kynurenine 3-monooxygenase
MPDKPQHIAIIGAGLVGSLMAIYLTKRGYAVSVFERRPDVRKGHMEAGRSINLALSNRGLRALKETGMIEAVRKITIPMHGRIIHDAVGNTTMIPYGKQGEFINSIPRTDLNILLIEEAERLGAKFYFNHRCTSVDFQKTSISFQISTLQHLNTSTLQFNLIIGADGAYSAVRSAMQMTDRFNYSQNYIDHGYKEFHIPAGKAGEFIMEKNGLHIWPRESFMMIALPNPDGSFTATLFYPWEGDASFQSMTSDHHVIGFFKSTFPDFASLATDYLKGFKNNPTSSLVAVQCWPWTQNKTLLIGDAAHAIVPFYGQGMNAGFEDCRVLNDLLNVSDENLDHTLSEFQKLRKPDTDTMAQLAMDNFIEMRDLVADEDFKLRKKIEAKLHSLFPGKWIPLYSMVTFHDEIRYSAAHTIGQRQKAIMDEVMKTPGIHNSWENLDFGNIVERL